jgi:hypothetical protein
VSVELFRDDDQGHAAWLAATTRGYVLSIQRTLNPSDGRTHHAGCQTITGTPSRGRTWTGPYIKACSLSAPELDAWALAAYDTAAAQAWVIPATLNPTSDAVSSASCSGERLQRMIQEVISAIGNMRLDER